MVPNSLAALSDYLMTATVLVYSLALLGFAAEFAYGGGRRSAATSRAPEQRVLAGSGGPATVTDPPAAPPSGADGPSPGSLTAAGRAGLALILLGWVAQLGTIVTRGLAAGRLPWGDMYEFVTVLTFVAVTVYLVLHFRQGLRSIGLFVLIPVVLGLGLAVTVLHSTPGPLVPALHSYWFAIHVTAMIIASGIFTVATAATVLYLTADRYERRHGTGRRVGLAGIAAALPSKDTLDRLAYRTIVFGFPVFTFGVIAGAIWGEAAWGRYWGWDPKETWSFITWVIYAGYLHARSTAGWKGRSAAIVALLGFAALLFNLFGVNIWITGLHSYGGV